MSDIFEKYGDKQLYVYGGMGKHIRVGKFTLNELAEALEEKLYPKFKERFLDEVKVPIGLGTEDLIDEASGD